MFSYRHSFHAGNHADVIKHLCQVMVIEKLKEKTKPFVYIDTHAGAGLYKLDSEQAKKTSEYKTGAKRISGREFVHPQLRVYQALAQTYIDNAYYPGSPQIAADLLREQDNGIVIEWSNTEVGNLKRNMRDSGFAVHHRDGFEALKALTPPSIKRGLVLIDPPYESASEYQQVIDSVMSAYQRWPQGIFMIWYPILTARTETDDSFKSAQSKSHLSQVMLNAIANSEIDNALKIELNTDPEGQGMTGSGLIVINSPWQFKQNVETALNELLPVMADLGQASMSCQWLREPKS